MIKNNLSEILGRKRIKMADLARKAGLNKNTVLNLYHDRSTRIEFEVLNKLCNILECTPSDILQHTPDLDAPALAAGGFGAKIPTKDKAIQIGENEFIDEHGNKFDRGTIEINEAMGGEFERVSASMFDDPLGLNHTDDEDSHCDVCDNLLEYCECDE